MRTACPPLGDVILRAESGPLGPTVRSMVSIESVARYGFPSMKLSEFVQPMNRDEFVPLARHLIGSPTVTLLPTPVTYGDPASCTAGTSMSIGSFRRVP